MSLGGFKSTPRVASRKVILVKSELVRGHPEQADNPEWFLVLTDPPPRNFVCSGATEEQAIKRAEDMGYSFEEDPEPFPPGYRG